MERSRMARTSIIVLSLSALLIGGLSCKSAPRPPRGDTPRPENLEIPKEMFDERTFIRQREEEGKIAKTVEWIDVGSKEGMTYLQGKIIVDRVIRDDAEDIFGVRVRIRNLTAEPIECETEIRFFDIRNNRRLGLHDGWKSIHVKPLDFFSIENTSKTTGAVGFRLFIRLPGSAEEGAADFTGDTDRLLPSNPMKSPLKK